MAKKARTSLVPVGQIGSRIERLIESTTAEPIPDEVVLGHELPGVPDRFTGTRARFALVDEAGHDLGLTETLRHLRHQSKPASPKAMVDEVARLRASIHKQILAPTLSTEFAASAVGIAFYAALGAVSILALTLGKSVYTPLATFAVGTGGAVAYLKQFQTSLSGWFRTRRSLLNIEAAWRVEESASPEDVRNAALQMRAFFGQVTKLPPPYDGTSNPGSG